MAAAALLVALMVSFVPPADAQAPVTGTADFRNAPLVTPGSYTDRIVTGDSAWYAVVYTNDTPYEFSVDFQGSGAEGLDLTASFVAPTLATVDGPAVALAGSGSYPVGSTNVWFVKVTLETSGQVGVEYPIVLTVAGIESVGTEDCSTDASCTLDDELAATTTELEELRSSAEVVRAAETTDRVEAEIENLIGFRDSANALLPGAQSRLNRAEASMADLCNPDPFCDPIPNPGSSTPLLGWVVGLAALAGGGYLFSKKLGSADGGDNADNADGDKKASMEAELARAAGTAAR